MTTFMRGYDVCAYLGISDETWRRWRKQGIAPQPISTVGVPRWLKAHIDDFQRWRQSGGRTRHFFQTHRKSA